MVDEDNISDQESNTSNGFVKIEHDNELLEDMDPLIEEAEDNQKAENKEYIQEEDTVMDTIKTSEPHVVTEDIGENNRCKENEPVIPVVKEEVPKEPEHETKADETKADDTKKTDSTENDTNKATVQNIPVVVSQTENILRERKQIASKWASGGTPATPDQDTIEEEPKRKHWSFRVYNRELQLREGWDEDGDDEFEAVPQWGFMKGLIENDYVPHAPDLNYSGFYMYIALSLLTTFTMVTIGALSKFGLSYSAHPHQLALFKTVLMVLIALTQKPSLSKLSQLGMTKFSFIKRGMLMGGLALSMQFVAKTLPLSITATVHSLSPVVNSIMATLYLGETINPRLDIPVLMACGVGTFICAKPPIVTGSIAVYSFSTAQYVALGLAVCQVLIRSNLMIFGRELRKNGAKTDHFTSLMFFDACCSAVFTMTKVLVNGTSHKVFTVPDWRLVALLVVVAVLHQTRPYLMSKGSSNLDVSVTSVLSQSNVLFSILYSLFLFQDNSVDKFYVFGTGLVLIACLVKLNIVTTDTDTNANKGKDGRGQLDKHNDNGPGKGGNHKDGKGGKHKYIGIKGPGEGGRQKDGNSGNERKKVE